MSPPLGDAGVGQSGLNSRTSLGWPVRLMTQAFMVFGSAAIYLLARFAVEWGIDTAKKSEGRKRRMKSQGEE